MLDIFVEGFFINSLVAMFTVSMVTGALGSFMIWQKLSYLGDSISHSSLLGIALALIFHTNTAVSIVFIAIIFAILLSVSMDRLYSIDTVLNIITNITLAIGLLLISFFPNANSDIVHSLFGDIIMLSHNDLLVIFFIAIAIILALIYRWRAWLIISMNQDLAISEGINVPIIRLEFLIILSVFIAISAQITGILLITAFLVIPAASARLVSKTPSQMIVLSTIISVISGILGLLLSVQFDTFPGPSIIVTSSIFLLLLYFYQKLRRNN